MSVRDVVTSQPRTVAPHDNLAVAAERMWAGDCGALPVVSDDGAVVAMITDRDICMAAWSRGLAPAELRVEEAMSRAVVVCRADDPLETVEGLMRTGQVRRLPVVDEANRLLGIISLADIARTHERLERSERSRASNGLSTTLAIICEPPPARSPSSAEAAPAEAPTADAVSAEAEVGSAAATTPAEPAASTEATATPNEAAATSADAAPAEAAPDLAVGPGRTPDGRAA